MRTYVAVFLVGLLAGAPDRAAAETKVAVLDLSSPGFSVEEGKSLSANLVNVLVTAVGRLGYHVVSSSDINAMLSFEKQKELLGCEDNFACLAEIGGALGTELMIAGSIGKLGATYSLSLTLIETKTNNVRQRFQGTAGSLDVLTATAGRGVDVLFGKERDLSGTATLFIKTEPPGGTVMLDGKEVGAAPVTLDDVPSGDHLIVAKKGDLTGTLTVHAAPQTVERLTLELKGAPPVKLKVLSNPPEARVFVDGDEVGSTPLMIAEVRPGVRHIRLRLKGYETQEEVMNLSSDEYEKSGKTPFKLEAKLTPVWRWVRPQHLPPIGIAIGAVADPRRIRDGVSFIGEAFIEPVSRLEAALGFGYPTAIPLTIRYWVWRGSLSAGILGRCTAIDRQKNAGWSFSALSGGVTAELGLVHVIGTAGIRAEATVNFDLPAQRYVKQTMTFPVALTAFWRL